MMNPSLYRPTSTLMPRVHQPQMKQPQTIPKRFEQPHQVKFGSVGSVLDPSTLTGGLIDFVAIPIAFLGLVGVVVHKMTSNGNSSSQNLTESSSELSNPNLPEQAPAVHPSMIAKEVDSDSEKDLEKQSGRPAPNQQSHLKEVENRWFSFRNKVPK